MPKFNNDGTINVERYTLHKEGFSDIKIRKILDQWEILSYKNPHTGEERWTKLNFFEEIIQKNIKEYCIYNNLNE